MPFRPKFIAWNFNLTLRLKKFAEENDFLTLYRSYSWRDDTYASEFRDIVALESRLTSNDKTTGITLDDVREVARWGGLPTRNLINGQPIALPSNSLHAQGGDPLPVLEHKPTLPIDQLCKSVSKGVGPTYLSRSR